MPFKKLISHPKLLQAIEESGYTVPTPIQLEAIPKILTGADLQASAQTGTGKTAAFLLPTLLRLTQSTPAQGQGPRILILVPTRELAMQVASQAVKYSKYLPRMRTVCIYGGAPYPVQNKDLSRPYEILVATPGRLIDHLDRGRIQFSRVEVLILDEADRMLDMGFIDPVKRIVSQIPPTRQTLLFSATLKGSVLNLAKFLLKNPLEIQIEQDVLKPENIEQRLYQVDNLDHKYRLLKFLLEDTSMHQAIIFTATKRQTENLADQLRDGGCTAAALHGDMNQRQRTRTLMRLRRNEIQVLVATDVAARGIDVQTISHVFNFDLPMNAEDYVHRIGRTGRAGASGIALSFAAGKDMQAVKQIEHYTQQKMTPVTVPGFEPTFKTNNAFKPKRGKGRPNSFSRPKRFFQGKRKY